MIPRRPVPFDARKFWLCDINVRYAIGQSVGRNNQWLSGTYLEFGGVNIATPPAAVFKLFFPEVVAMTLRSGPAGRFV